MREEQRGLSRRSFLNFSLWSSILFFFGSLIWIFFRFVANPRSSSQPRSNEHYSLPINEINIDEAKFIRFEGRPAIVIRTGEIEVHALSAVCTHLGCIVQWKPEGKQLFCPCHAAVFDIYGNVISGPPPRPLPRYNAFIRKDEIIIQKA